MGIDSRESFVDQTDGHGGDARRQPPSIRAGGLGSRTFLTCECPGQARR